MWTGKKDDKYIYAIEQLIFFQSRQCVWEQEIYNQFRYKSPRDYFHTFEAEVRY